jgi:hypothetical protein
VPATFKRIVDTVQHSQRFRLNIGDIVKTSFPVADFRLPEQEDLRKDVSILFGLNLLAAGKRKSVLFLVTLGTNFETILTF